MDRLQLAPGRTDYMVGGWWLLVPKDLQDPAGDYRLWGSLLGVRISMLVGMPMYGRQVKPAVTGEATYKGPAAGLFVSSET